MQENTKKFIIAAVIIIAVSMVSLNLGFTGAVPRADKVTFLSAEQDGMMLIVKLSPTYTTAALSGFSNLRSAYPLQLTLHFLLFILVNVQLYSFG